MTLVETSYPAEWVEILLQDVRGRVPILDTAEREKLNQSGVHYSEMLPLEYAPTEKYMRIYQESLAQLSLETANAVAALANKIRKRRGDQVVLVSLARAGTPIGILVKSYAKKTWNLDWPHYSISIIRGKGIDVAAMKMIVDRHPAEELLFLDGWVGKGAIQAVLEQACLELKALDPARFENLDDTLAVLSDPASVTDLYGTRQDFLIPSACLNATVSGLVSRTVKLPTMTDHELHGAVYYGENASVDQSISFIEEVQSHFNQVRDDFFQPSVAEQDEDFKGIDEVREVATAFGITDINKVKPGVGETTRVLLRRVPDRILVAPNANQKYLQHILQLADEKEIPVEVYPLKKYNVCGIIKTVADL